MFTLQGSQTEAKVFTDNIDQVTIDQIIQMCNEPITTNTQVRIMPDTHYGKGATIGTTIQLGNPDDWKISPNIVGVDIACGMLSYKLNVPDIDLQQLDGVVNKVVPAGPTLHTKAQNYSFVKNLLNNLTFQVKDPERHQLGLGTLGGGNHFLELAKDESGSYWLTVHSGSRSFGAQIAKHHQNIADDYHFNHREEIQELIKTLKAQGRDKEIQSTLQSFKSTRPTPQLPYLENQLLLDYLHDLQLAEQYAHMSRKIMLENILKEMNLLQFVDMNASFDSVHNTIDSKNGIIRKGATSAYDGEMLIIPLNMRDGSLICRGKGNADWNFSAPHGAGRILSRSQARQIIDLEEYKQQMSGIYTSSVGESTLDEAPGVYKPAEEIKSLIGDTVEIIHHVKPVYNFKAH